ncbi:MAG TPA: acyltransferase [Spirochaetia bacterium]|nr:acyltransferase [Spirochaetia bacterium]
MTNNINRFSKLDGLRGLLALIVCLNHSFMVVTIPTFANVWQQNPLIFNGLQSKIQQLLMLLGNGGAAVTLFFLLSGLVLGQSLSRININLKGIFGFLVKRIIRLYPVYLVIVFLTALYMKFGFVYETFPYSSAWFNWWMNFQMTFKEFFLNFFFIHTYLGGVTWTLRVILIMSFIFPVFFLINKKTTWWIDILITVLLVYLSFTLLNIDGFRDLRYTYMFYLGLIIPKFKDLFSKIPNNFIVVSLPFLILLLLGFRYLTNEYKGGVIESLVSFLIIGLAAYGSKVTVLDILEGKILHFFGKISYSLYLIHFSVLYVLGRLMFQNFPQLPYQDQYLSIHIILFVLSTVTATGISYLVYKFVEMPSQTLAKAVGAKLSEE